MDTGKTFTQSKIMYVAAAVLTLLMAVAAFESPAGAWPLCLAAIACVAIANLDRLSEVTANASGFRILLRDATRKVDEFTEIAKLSARVGLSLVQRSGRLGGYSDDEKESFLNETVGLLRSAGISDDHIKEIRGENWDNFVKYDYVFAILGNSQAPRNLSEEERLEWGRLRNFRQISSPDELEDFLRRTNSLQGLREELLSEYRYYVQHLNHRRPEIWHQRNEVPPISK